MSDQEEIFPLNVDEMIPVERSYTRTELDLRNRFIGEYIRDFSIYASSVRMGYMGDDAVAFGKAMLDEPYVRREVAKYQETRFVPEVSKPAEPVNQYTKQTEEQERQQIISMLFKEANYNGPGSTQASRVSALGRLADIYRIGKDADKGSTTSQNVMIVPALGSVDDWEKRAQLQQEALKASVKE